jgi:hypothetical protein
MAFFAGLEQIQNLETGKGGFETDILEIVRRAHDRLTR